MKKTLLILLSFILALPAMGQTSSSHETSSGYETSSGNETASGYETASADKPYLVDILADEWKYAFSAEGREQWKPEITARAKVGIYTGGYNLTGGVRIDSKRTLGLMLGQGTTFIDSAPGNVYHLQAAAYMRRYFHLGSRDIVAFYSDLSIGAGCVYKVTGRTIFYPVEGMEVELIHQKPGDVGFLIAWEPGIRFRIYRNLHIFLGPTISTACLGVHLGLGI